MDAQKQQLLAPARFAQAPRGLRIAVLVQEGDLELEPFQSFFFFLNRNEGVLEVM